MRYYRYFRQRILAGQGARGDVGYVHLLAQEAVNGLLDQPRGHVLRKLLANTQKISDDTRIEILWWVLDAARLDREAGGVEHAAALTTGAPHTTDQRDLALQGLLVRMDGGTPLSPPTLDARSILGGLPELPFDRYGAPQPFTNQAALAALTAADTYFHERPPLRRSIIETFPTQRHAPILRHAFQELLYDGDDHPDGLLVTVPAHHENDKLLQTLRHTLYMGQMLVLEQLGVPGERYHTDDAFTRAVATYARDLLREFLQRAQVPVELFRLQAGSLETLGRPEPRKGQPIRQPSREVVRAAKGLTDRDERLQAHQALVNERVYDQQRREPSYMPRDIRLLREDSLAYYLFWRTRWREDHLLVSRESNLLQLYAFEIHNLVGFQTAEESYAEVWELLDAIHRVDTYPDWTAMDWPVTLACMYDLADTPPRAYFHTLVYHPFQDADDRAMAGWLVERDLDELTFDTLKAVFGFDAYRGVYLERAPHPDRYLQGLRMALHAADVHFLQHRQVGLFDHDYFTGPGRWVEDFHRYLPIDDFFGVNAEIKRPMIVPERGAAYTLRAFTGSLFKHVENRFRKADGISGSRRVESHPMLTPELLTDVDAAIQPWLGDPKPKVTLSFDPTEVAALEARSAATRELLITDEERAAAQHDPAPSAVETIGIPTPIDVGGLTGPATAPGEYVAFAADLNHLHLELLRLLLQGASLGPLERAARAHKALLGAALDEINERALDTLGDTLVDTSSDPPAVLEEHHQPVTAALLEHAS